MVLGVFLWIMYTEKSAAENVWFKNILEASVKDSVDGIC